MADLEEQFLQSNVPGRYSAWDDAEETGLASNRHDESEVEGTTSVVLAPTALNRSEATPSTQTGPKGVLADRRAAKEEEAYRREMEKRETEAIIDRAVRGTQLAPGEASLAEVAMQERRRAEKARAREAECCDYDSDDEIDDNANDDDFMRCYRQKRLLEMQANARQQQQQAALPTSAHYGQVEDATPIQYSEAVDEADVSQALLVVHLYEPYLPACTEINNQLELLARAVPSVRFLRLRATEARPGFDPVGLPSLLAYRGNTLVRNYTPVTDHLPDRYTAEDLRILLDFDASNGNYRNRNFPERSILAGEEGANNISVAPENATDGYDSGDVELDEYCADFALTPS